MNTLIAALAVLSSLTAAPADTVKLKGCLVKGSGDGAGYLLVNSPTEPPSAISSAGSQRPGSVGTTGAYANIFYWLDKDDFLQPHVGHEIEIEGDAKDIVTSGEIKIERHPQWTEIEVKSDGRTMKAQVPNSSIVAPEDPKRKVEVLVQRVDVDKLRMLAASCR